MLATYADFVWYSTAWHRAAITLLDHSIIFSTYVALLLVASENIGEGLCTVHNNTTFAMPETKLFNLFILCYVFCVGRAEPCFLSAKKTFLKPTVILFQEKDRSSLIGITDDLGSEVTNELRTEDDSSTRMRKSGTVGRRQLFWDLGISVAAASAAAHADDSSMIPVPSVKSICDPTVESYRKGSSQIHIVGTAHVSSASAVLAGNAVKEVKVCYGLIIFFLKWYLYFKCSTGLWFPCIRL